MQKKEIITISINSLPEELSRLHTPPASLNALGDMKLLDYHPRVGIVGARKFTPYGREVTATIAQNLARAGVTVVSGLALGVDSIAHKACLDAGGQTIAVLPSGIDSIYPANHRGLARQIVDSGGLLVSEYPPKYQPQRHSFIERNRIIAALSDILIITEAAVASGSLHTASFALELGVQVMAVPGNITSPYSAGTNHLIQTGAMPLLTPSDILNQLGISSPSQQAYIPENAIEQSILELISSGTTQTNEIISKSDLETPTVQTALTMLEIKGIVAIQSGRWSLL